MPFSFLIVCHRTSSQLTKNCKLFIPGSRNHLIVLLKEACHIAQPTDSSDNPALFTVRTRSTPWPLCHCRGDAEQSTSSSSAQEPGCGDLYVPSQMNSPQAKHPLPSSNINQVPSFLLFLLHSSSHMSLSPLSRSESRGCLDKNLFLSWRSIG